MKQKLIRRIVTTSGTVVWKLDSLLHREDGPAVEWSDGDKYWYLDDIRYREEEWKEEMYRRNLKKVLK